VDDSVIPTPRLQVFNETGATSLSVLRGYTSCTVSQVLSDLGSLALEFPRDLGGAAPLLVDADRQIKVIYPGLAAMWFLLDEDSSTWVSDAPQQEGVTVTCRSLAGLLDEAPVLPAGGIGAVPAEYAFTAPTPGQIVTTLVAQAQSHGWLQGMTVAGSATLDASGVAWDSMPDTTYTLGSSLLTVLKGLSDAQVLEWQFSDRVLQLYAPASGLDRTLALTLRPGHDVLSAPLQRSRRAVATDVVVEGADGASVLRSATLPGRRRRGVYVSQTTAPAGALNQIGDYYLGAHSSADVQTTHDLADGDDAPRPWIDYRPGDRIRTTAAGGGVTVERIAQVAVRHDDSGSTPTLEVGSILEAAEEKFARQLSRLLPSAESLT
jgi:hypothetical protein